MSWRKAEEIGLELSTSTVNDWAKKLELPLGAVGFLYGATHDTPPAAGPALPMLEQRIVDTIAKVTGQHITIGAQTSGLSQTFNLTGFINKGLGVAIALELANEVAGSGFGIISKAVKTVHAWGMPIALGYSAGGFFDPAPSGYTGGNALTYGTGSATQATQAANINNLLNTGANV